MDQDRLPEESVETLDVFAAPWGREVMLQNVTHESGMALLRVRIRENRRFTILDLDPATAEHWGRAMLAWAEARK